VFDTAGGIAETTVRNIVLANAAAVPVPEAGAVVTTTAGTSAGVVTEMQSARNTLEVITDTMGELPDAFVRGGRIALIGLLALGAYVLAKKVLTFAIHRLTKRPIDYGR
jgi:hypothetical protein